MDSARRQEGLCILETALREQRGGGLTFGHIDHTVDLVTSGHRGKRSKVGGRWLIEVGLRCCEIGRAKEMGTNVEPVC